MVSENAEYEMNSKLQVVETERETFALTTEARNKSEYNDVSMGTCACNTKEPLFDDLASTLKQDLPPLLAA